MTITALLCALPVAQAADVLSDAQLDQVTAGTASVVYDRERGFLELHKITGRGTAIGVVGNANFNFGPTIVNAGVLHLEGNAQSNLRALINTNAVNSPVQVLMNLNININSFINNLNQVNSGLQQR
jgi:hypothetical protein